MMGSPSFLLPEEGLTTPRRVFLLRRNKKVGTPKKKEDTIFFGLRIKK
jgi:hypothetical protein